MPFSYGSRRIWVPAMAAFLLVLMSVPMARAAQPEWDSWDFRLLDSLNQATDGSQTIVLTGKGSFDISPPGSISGGGGFTILGAGGAVVDSGTWTARTLDLADTEVPSGPGGSPGENGHLELEADFNGTGGSWSAHVVIQCSMWGDVTVGPPGFPWPADFVEVGPYTTPVSGAVMFNLNH